MALETDTNTTSNEISRFAERMSKPLRVGAAELKNRFVLAPLCRLRADDNGVPPECAITYYSQRATAGLVITEGCIVSESARGYSKSACIYAPEHVAMWRKVNDAVHAQGAKTCCQLWHTGRIGHPDAIANHELPVAPSPITNDNVRSSVFRDGCMSRVACPVPRELKTCEIPLIMEEFKKAARCAFDAGFDLVELHAAHGYLCHQFYCTNSNQRTDQYGGSLENRMRFTLEVVDALCAVKGPEYVGVRIFPIGEIQGCDNGPLEEAEANALVLIGEIARRGVAYLHISEPDFVGGARLRPEFRARIRAAFPGTIIVAGAYDIEKALTVLEPGYADAVAFGRKYIANPDLPTRLMTGAELNPDRPEYHYGGGEVGYTDYPTLQEQKISS